MCSCDSPKIRDIGDGTHRKSTVDETIVDEHVRHPKNSDSQPLHHSTAMEKKEKKKKSVNKPTPRNFHASTNQLTKTPSPSHQLATTTVQHQGHYGQLRPLRRAKPETEKNTHSTEAEARKKALVEESVGHEPDRRNRVYDRENIVQLERPFPRPMVGLHTPSAHVSPSHAHVSVTQKQNQQPRKKTISNTSCMCHRDACQSALCAHLAQNSIPT